MTKPLIEAQKLDEDKLKLPDNFLAPALFHSIFWKPRFSTADSISAHLPLLFWITSAHRPRRICVIGADNGVAHFAFCQAIEHLGIEAVCDGFGFWQISEAGGSQYNIPDNVSKHQDMLYDGISRLIGSESVSQIARNLSSGSIDIVFIDLTCTPAGDEFNIKDIISVVSNGGLLIVHGLSKTKSPTEIHAYVSENFDSLKHIEIASDGGILIVARDGETRPPLKSLLDSSINGYLRRDIDAVFRRCGSGTIATAQLNSQISINNDIRERLSQAGVALKKKSDDYSELISLYELRSEKIADAQAKLFSISTDNQLKADELRAASEKLDEIKANYDDLISNLENSHAATRAALNEERKLRLDESLRQSEIYDDLLVKIAEAEREREALLRRVAILSSECESHIKVKQSLLEAETERDDARKLLELERRTRFHETATLTRIAEDLRAENIAADLSLASQAKAGALEAELKFERSQRFSETTTLTSEVRELRKQILDAQNEKYHCEQRIQDLLASTSWKITAPMRIIKGIFSRR